MNPFTSAFIFLFDFLRDNLFGIRVRMVPLARPADSKIED